jgi:hypothetical protein
MIILPLMPALNLFASAVVVFDLVGERVGGRWRELPEPDRRISGAIQPADERTLNVLPEGDRSDGAVLLHTQARLSWYDVEQGGISNRQTIIRHGGSLWRVLKPQDWTTNTPRVWRYVATRYLNNDTDDL